MSSYSKYGLSSSYFSGSKQSNVLPQASSGAGGMQSVETVKNSITKSFGEYNKPISKVTIKRFSIK